MNFDSEIKYLTKLLAAAPEVEVGEWQAIREVDSPFSKTIEVEDVTIDVEIPSTIEEWQRDIGPNLPWAEEHFLERVSGVAWNPPPSHVRWPYAQKDNDEHREQEKFSHTYPERIWPKFVDTLGIHHGLRYDYGDLDDVIKLLKERPATRQAYLPIWFPEDTGAIEGQRVPCTLGYHFLRRSGGLKVVYYIRSCDFYRHFRDDVYMAGRLGQFVAEAIGAIPSHLVMHISSLHIFTAERSKIEAEAGYAV